VRDDREVPATPEEPEREPGTTGAPMQEREVQHEPQVLEGDDELPRQPTSQRDPFVPEPGPRPGEWREWRVMRLAWIPLLVVVAIVLIAALR
jgi:hypothetical protein